MITGPGWLVIRDHGSHESLTYFWDGIIAEVWCATNGGTLYT